MNDTPDALGSEVANLLEVQMAFKNFDFDAAASRRSVSS